MSTARPIASMFGLAFLFSLTGCVMSNTPMKAPQTSSAIEVPSATSTEALFSCAETTVQALADTDDRWDPRVTRRDVEAGVLETSNYGKENESGFRIRLRFVSGSGQAQVGLKGAGAYFIDLGVEEAMTRFKSKMSVCLSSR
ncbi:hypothetical protein GCM10023307_15580 [Lysobacter hankyongensis]|uniref:Lipoprotein n=2 Tax=Lysobacter hankyongensis TaxID=1176535 RepID=A0ABP9B8F5_9GAMM